MIKKLKYFIGEIITKIRNFDDEQLIFTFENGNEIKMYHDQNCCEYVLIESIDGNLDDLLNTPILMAEEVNNVAKPALYDCDNDSYTWTFYKFATVKGYVTIRWYGSSNGCYSEEVDFSLNGCKCYDLPKDFYIKVGDES